MAERSLEVEGESEDIFEVEDEDEGALMEAYSSEEEERRPDRRNSKSYPRWSRREGSSVVCFDPYLPLRFASTFFDFLRLFFDFLRLFFDLLRLFFDLLRLFSICFDFFRFSSIWRKGQLLRNL